MEPLLDRGDDGSHCGSPVLIKRRIILYNDWKETMINQQDIENRYCNKHKERVDGQGMISAYLLLRNSPSIISLPKPNYLIHTFFHGLQMISSQFDRLTNLPRYKNEYERYHNTSMRYKLYSLIQIDVLTLTG